MSKDQDEGHAGMIHRKDMPLEVQAKLAEKDSYRENLKQVGDESREAENQKARAEQEAKKAREKREAIERIPSLFDKGTLSEMMGRLEGVRRAGVETLVFQDGVERSVRDLMLRLDQTEDLVDQLNELDDQALDTWLAEQGIATSKVSSESAHGFREAVALAIRAGNDHDKIFNRLTGKWESLRKRD